MRLPCIPNGENVGIFSLLFSRSHLTTKKSAHISAHPRVYHECGRTIEEVRVRGRLRVREVRVHGFATVRDSSSSSSSSSLARAFFLARIFWTPLDGGKKKKKKKKKRSTTNFRGWVGNREEEVKENENVPFFARIFFSFPSKSKKRYKKKYDSERPQNYFREQNSDVSLSLSYLPPC